MNLSALWQRCSPNCFIVVVVVALPSPLSETRSLASTLGIVNGTWSIHWASFVMQEANRTLRTKESGDMKQQQKQEEQQQLEQ